MPNPLTLSKSPIESTCLRPTTECNFQTFGHLATFFIENPNSFPLVAKLEFNESKLLEHEETLFSGLRLSSLYGGAPHSAIPVLSSLLSSMRLFPKLARLKQSLLEANSTDNILVCLKNVTIPCASEPQFCAYMYQDNLKDILVSASGANADQILIQVLTSLVNGGNPFSAVIVLKYLSTTGALTPSMLLQNLNDALNESSSVLRTTPGLLITDSSFQLWSPSNDTDPSPEKAELCMGSLCTNETTAIIIIVVIIVAVLTFCFCLRCWWKRRQQYQDDLEIASIPGINTPVDSDLTSPVGLDYRGYDSAHNIAAMEATSLDLDVAQSPPELEMTPMEDSHLR